MKTKLRNNKEAKRVKERDRAFTKKEGRNYFEERHPEYISPNFHKKTNKR